MEREVSILEYIISVNKANIATREDMEFVISPVTTSVRLSS